MIGGGGGGRVQKMNYLGRRCVLNCGFHSKCEKTEEKLLPSAPNKDQGVLAFKGIGFCTYLFSHLLLTGNPH